MIKKAETKLSVQEVMDRWALWCNNSQTGIGPKQVSAPSPIEDSELIDLEETGLNIRCHSLVETLLNGVGKGAYCPVRLRALLMHIHWKGQDIETYCLLKPGEGLGSPAVELGFLPKTLINIAYENFLIKVAKFSSIGV